MIEFRTKQKKNKLDTSLRFDQSDGTGPTDTLINTPRKAAPSPQMSASIGTPASIGRRSSSSQSPITAEKVRKARAGDGQLHRKKQFVGKYRSPAKCLQAGTPGNFLTARPWSSYPVVRGLLWSTAGLCKSSIQEAFS